MSNKEKKNTTKLLINIASIIIYSFIYLLFIYFSYNENTEYDFGARGYIVLIVVYISLLINFSNVFGLFEIGNKRISEIIISDFFSLLLSNILAYFVFSLIEGHLVVISPFIKLFFVQEIFSVLFSYVGSRLIRFNYKPEKTLFIYGNDGYKGVYNKLVKYQPYEFSIQQCISENKINFSKLEYLLSDFENIITYEVKYKNKRDIIKKCYEMNINVYDVPSILDVLIKTSIVTNFIDTPLFKISRFGPSNVENIIKRVIDLIVSIFLLIILSPGLFFVAIIIKLQDGGSVFFKQERLTLNGKRFELIKFRSMIMNAEPDGKMIPAKENDKRITKFGKIMRATRLDELPQIINVLKGDISLVGPRALRVEEYDINEEEFPEFKYRLKVKAGITGYAQVYGKYNTTFRDKLLLDMFYIENYNLIMDFKIMLMTLVVIFKKDSTEGF